MSVLLCHVMFLTKKSSTLCRQINLRRKIFKFVKKSIQIRILGGSRVGILKLQDYCWSYFEGNEYGTMDNAT